MISAKEYADSCESLRDVPFTRNGRTTRGVDCVGLAIVGASEIGIRFKDEAGYDATMPDPEMVIRMLDLNLERIPPADIGEGCVVLCRRKEGKPANHIVVTLADRKIIHVSPASGRARVVSADWLEGRLVQAFRVPQVEYGSPW